MAPLSPVTTGKCGKSRAGLSHLGEPDALGLWLDHELTAGRNTPRGGPGGRVMLAPSVPDLHPSFTPHLARQRDHCFGLLGMSKHMTPQCSMALAGQCEDELAD